MCRQFKKNFFYEISYNGVVSPFLMPKEIDMTSWKAIKDSFNQKCSNADFAADHTIDIMEEEVDFEDINKILKQQAEQK